MTKIFLIFLLILLVSPSFAQQPENVLVITIDGIRNDEAFEAESLNLRHIWNDLRPLGTIYRRFWNRGWTATTAGHNTIACGVRQIVRNNSGTDQDIRPDQPTFFEYFRSRFGLPESKAGAIMGKGNCRCVDFGLEGSYGENYKGFLIYNAPDSTISNLVHQAMDSIQPRLLYINLRDVDGAGHGGIDSVYHQSIITADSIVYEFWQHIQAIPPYSDTFYKDKTVMIVTSDHGRNDDAHGGYQGHGEWDHGCRDLMFLALGPGIRQNQVINDIDRDQIDIVPTVGYILGFPTYFSEGEEMEEIFTTDFKPKKYRGFSYSYDFGLNLSNTQKFSREPEIAVDRNGRIHVVWTDNSRGEWEVYYRKSVDGGLTWSPTRILFDFPGNDSVMWFANIDGDDSLIVSAMGYAKIGQEIDSLPPSRIDTTFVWYPWVATSIDEGDNWHITSMPDSNMGSYASPVAVKNGRYSIAYWMVGKFGYERTQEGLNFNWRNAGENWQDSVPRIINKKFLNIKLMDDGSSFHIVGCCIQRNTEDWEIGYWRSENGIDWNRVWITKDSGDVFFDYDPSLVKDDSGNLHIVWARKEDVGGTWQIYYTRSTDNGNTWSAMVPISSSMFGAWKPDIASKEDTLYVVWVDYRDGNSEIYGCRSTDRGVSWLSEERITFDNTFSTNPKIEVWNDKLLLVWQDYRDGNWEIYFNYLPGSSTIHDVGPARLSSPGKRIIPNDSIIPQAWIRNYGDVFETFRVYLEIEPAYFDSVQVTTAPHDSSIVSFSRTWNATLGSYLFKLYTTLNTDQNLTNDTITDVIEVVGDSWVQIDDLPLGPRNRKVKAGGCLVYVPDQNLIYALKGNNTNEFYVYSLSTGDWFEKESIPYDPNQRRKRVKRGAALCYDGARYIYAAKGKNSTEFWRYDTKAGYSDTIWKILAPVPLPPSNKKLKGGTGLAYATKGSDHYVYLLKGSKTTDFYAFHIEGDSWIKSLVPAPLGPSGKPFKKGSGMIKVDNNLYVIKSYYNELFRFDLLGDTWHSTPFSPMPFVGRSYRKKKIKDGAALCYDGINRIFAFKGGNTDEFWAYSISQDTWIQYADLPRLPSWKRVKSGGALTFAQGRVYGLKGNNTPEFWFYAPGLTTWSGNRIKKSISSATNQFSEKLQLIIAPNPSRGHLRIRYSLVDMDNLSFRVYDVSGIMQQRVSLSGKSGIIDLPIHQLASGVYFLQVETGRFKIKRKFILRR